MAESHELSSSCNPLPSGGYEDGMFIEPPSEAQGLHCPVCLMVLKEPHLLSCCGKHICEICIHPIKTGGQSCPCCREQQFFTLLNKEKKGKVLELKVYCANHKHGCVWKGELGDAERHLGTRCDYVEEECPYGCGGRYLRQTMLTHQREECIKRPMDVKMESFTRKMEEKLNSLETRYEKKISMLEKKLMQQEQKHQKEYEEMKRAKVQYEEKEKQLQDQVQTQMMELGKVKKESERLQNIIEEDRKKISQEVADSQENTKRHLTFLDQTTTTTKADVLQINEKIKEMGCQCIQKVSVSQDALHYLQHTSEWTEMNSTMAASGIDVSVDKHVSDGNVARITVKKRFTTELDEATSKVSKMVTSVQKRAVSIPATQVHILEYLFNTENGTKVIHEMERRMSVGFEKGSNFPLAKLNVSVDIIIYGLSTQALHNAEEEVLAFTNNIHTQKILDLSVSRIYDWPKIFKLAEKKGVLVERPSSSFEGRQKSHDIIGFKGVQWSRDIVTLKGGRYDVQLVEDEFEDAIIDNFEGIQFQTPVPNCKNQ